jgi:hypothetical protein
VKGLFQTGKIPDLTAGERADQPARRRIVAR